MSREPNHPEDEPAAHPGHFVRQWRDYMGWSQEELGEMVHAHQTKIARIETGERGLKTGFLKELARAFGVDQGALLTVNPSTKEGRQTAELLVAWHRLTTRQREVLLQMVSGLVGADRSSDAS